jgi:ketosteroid isomerase-like protein
MGATIWIPEARMRSSPTLCGFIMVVAAFASGAAQTSFTHSQSEAEQYIKSSESAWAESISTGDSSVVERILAEDCVWVLDGRVLTKSQAVADAKNGPGDFLSDHLEYAHVRFFGETALVQGSEIWTRKGGRKGRFVWTDTWLRRNGKWQIVAAEDDSVPIKN